MMEKITDTMKYACKYRVENFILMRGNEHVRLDASNILSIEYANDYEFNIRAMIKVCLRIDIRRKLWILKHKREITVKFELSKIGMDMESELFITNPQTVWNGVFAAYFNDEDESIDLITMEQRINMNESSQNSISVLNEENYFETQNTIDFYLFQPNAINASNTKFNGVFTKDILQNCVARILTATNHKNVLMSPFENDEVYEELIVPALPAYKALIYLDQYYGFYKTGALIYYDVDTTYILNTNGKMTAKRNNESISTCLYVTSMDNSQPGNGMFKYRSDYRNYCGKYRINYISVNESNVNSQKPSIGKNETVGSEAKFVISDDITVDIGSANQSTMNQRNETIAYIRKADNKFVANISKARMEENECILYFNGENIDMNALRPNKVFQVVFEDAGKNQVYGNYKYRLAFSYHCLVITSGEYMDSSHQMVLKKSADQ